MGWEEMSSTVLKLFSSKYETTLTGSSKYAIPTVQKYFQKV